MRSLRRVAAIAGRASSTTVASTKEKQDKFLNEFRQRLDAAESGTTLDDFVEQPAVSVTAAMNMAVKQVRRGEEPLPSWLKLKIPKGATARPKYNKIRTSMKAKGLATVCEEAKCPNIGECWGGGDSGEEAATATIMMMGAHCTRGCRFCSVGTMKNPPPLDPEEPNKVAQAASEMGVDYLVLTMVDRDDLADGGSAHVAKTINTIRARAPDLLVEALVGDFNGILERTSTIVESGLHVYAHNVECVERVTPNVRDRRAGYRQTLSVLEHAKRHSQTVARETPLVTKSSIMLGVGETEPEIRQTLRDLRTAGVDCVTLGQYLQPARTRMKVSRYAHPEEFAAWEREAMAMGFLYCASGPMVRSSYRAGEMYISNIIKGRKLEAVAKSA